MEELTFSHITWDTWNATRGGKEAIKARQNRRLGELFAFVRAHSGYCRDKYSGLPENVRQLPPVWKIPARMGREVHGPAIRWWEHPGNCRRWERF